MTNMQRIAAITSFKDQITMKESRTRKSAQNMMFSAAGQVLTLILSFVSRTIFLKYLSIEYLGINGLFSNILTILSFAELGIGNAMIYSMYKPLKENNTQKLLALIALYKKAYYIIAAVVAILGITLIPFLSYIIWEPPNIKESLTNIYVLYLFNTVSSYLLIYNKSILTADQNAYIVTISSSFVQVIRLVVQITVLYFTRDFLMFLYVQIAFTQLDNVVSFYIVNRMYPYIKQKNVVKLSKEESKSIFQNIKALAISKIAGVVASGTDNIIISALFGLSPVGLVSNYTLIINSLNSIMYSTLSGVTASVGNLNAGNDQKNKIEIFDQLLLLTYWMFSSICVCLIILLNPFIMLWLGKNYLLSDLTVISLVWIIYMSGMNYPAYVFRTTKGCFDQVKYVYVISAILNIILSIIFGKLIGIAGVFIATSISKLFTSEIADGYYAFKEALGQPPSIYFIKYCLLFLIFLGNILLTGWVVNTIFLTGLIGFLLKAIICFSFCNAVNLILFYRTKAFSGIIGRVKSLIKSYI